MTRCEIAARATVTRLAVFGLTAALLGGRFGLVRVQGSSMEPTFHNGQWLLMRRTHGPAPSLHYGDVVIFRLGGAFLVKRVAGLPGDPAPGLDVLPERASSRSIGPSRDRNSRAAAPLRVPNGCVYVLGDNSAVSEDSRDFGPVRASAVIGRIVPWAVNLARRIAQANGPAGTARRVSEAARG